MAYRNPQASRGSKPMGRKVPRGATNKPSARAPKARVANPQASRGATRAGRKVGWNNG